MDWYAFFRHVGNALNPAWISAILAAIGVIIALTIWWWPRRVFRGDTAAVTALLDRLLHHAHILKCGPRSWRTKVHTSLPTHDAVK